jgi:pimeloyl-ACP methyl ester carboxylesterase
LSGGGNTVGKATLRTVLAAGVGIAAAISVLVAWKLAHRQAVPATVAAQQAEPAAPSHVEMTPCWFEIPEGRAARCGAYVAGPEATGVPVAIRFVVFQGGAAEDPLVYINGGPGSAVGIDAAGIANWWGITRNAVWMQGRDVVVFDQPGVGVSTPSLDCPELAEAGGRIFIERLALDQENALWRDAASRCRQRLAQSGLRLAAFNTAMTVSALARILDDLGYRSWNLYGVSYGTRVALEFLRRGDPRTRSVILDSVYPPDVAAYRQAGANARSALDALVRRCLADAHCNAEAPHLADLLRQALAQAAGGGFAVPVGLAGGADTVAAIDQAKLVEILFYGFYRWDTIQHMPAVIAALARGDAQALAPFAREAYATAASPRSGYGAFLAVECHDEYPFENAASVAAEADRAGMFRDFMLSNLPVVACPEWPMGQAAPESREPVRSAVPVLLLSGEVDPITPPAWARHAAETLDHGVVFVFPGVGHGVVPSHACAARLAAKFLASPGDKPYDDCLLGLG